MNVADRLLKRFEANISQSLGVRSGGAPGSTVSEPRPAPQPVGPGPNDGRTRARSLGYMDIENVVPDPEQPRKEFDADSLRRLAQSLAKYGQLHPIRVRWDEGLKKWVIISGERRYRAALAAGFRMVICHFVDGEVSPARVLEEQVIENCLREGLKPVEQARAYRALMEKNSWSARKVAEVLHVASSTVTKALALLRLPEEVQEQVDEGVLAATVAYELAKLGGPDEKREAARRISRDGLRHDEATALVREAAGANREASTRARRPGAEDGAARPESWTDPGDAPFVREVRIGVDRADLEYTLPDGLKLTITTGIRTAAGDVVAAVSLVLERLRAELAGAADPRFPWTRTTMSRQHAPDPRSYPRSVRLDGEPE